MKVLGVGWAKTGTTSLGTCLEILGYRHRPQDFDLVPDLLSEDKARIRQVAEQHDSFDDWPWLLLYREFDHWFPGTKFVLTVRDSNAWLRSYRSQLDRSPTGENWDERRRILYGLPFPDVTDDMLVERYQRHNAYVRSYFADRSDDLLVVDWAEGDGWPELCGFLRKPVPAAAFPHSNKAKSAAPRVFRMIPAFLRRK